jgi:hypothetical protein
MERALRRLRLEVCFEVQRLAEIDESLAPVFCKHQHLPDHAGIVPVTEKDVRERFIIFFHGGLIENELRNDEDGTLHVSLRFKEELEMIFFSVNKSADKTFRVDQEDEGGRAFLDGFAVEAGLIRAGKFPRSVEEGELREEDLEKASDGQEQRHVEIKGDFGIRKPSSSEVVVIEKVIEVAAVLGRIDHRAFFLEFLQALLGVLFDLGSPEKGREHPPQQKPRLVLKKVRIEDFFVG